MNPTHPRRLIRRAAAVLAGPTGSLLALNARARTPSRRPPPAHRAGARTNA
jgi:hypothetical protein